MMSVFYAAYNVAAQNMFKKMSAGLVVASFSVETHTSCDIF